MTAAIFDYLICTDLKDLWVHFGTFKRYRENRKGLQWPTLCSRDLAQEACPAEPRSEWQRRAGLLGLSLRPLTRKADPIDTLKISIFAFNID